jgi:O-antigen/teichoic acid export membrane protein
MLRTTARRLRQELFGSQLRRNASAGALGTAANIAIMAASYPAYLHWLGFEQYGAWLALSTVLTFAQLGNLGLAQAVTRFVTVSRTAGDRDALEAYVASAVMGVGVIGVVLAVLVGACRQQILSALALPPPLAAAVHALVIPIALLSGYVLVTQVHLGVLVGLERLDQANRIQVLGRLIALVASCGGLAAGWGVGSLLAGNAVSYLVQHGATLAAIRREVGIGGVRLRAVSWARFRGLLGFGLGVCSSSLINMFLHPLNRILVARFAGVGAVPVFEIAYSGAMQLRAVAEGALRALMTEFTRVTAQDDWPRAQRLLSNALVLSAGGGVLIFGGMAAVAPQVLKGWLGSNFRPELVPVFRIMLANGCISLMGVPGYYYLLGIGEVSGILKSQAVQTALSAGGILVWVYLRGNLPLWWAATCVGLGILAATAYLIAATRASSGNQQARVSRGWGTDASR